MTLLETAARARFGGTYVMRLVPHPCLPLAAGPDSGCPAVRVWDYSPGQLRGAVTAGAGSAPYGDAAGWNRIERTRRSRGTRARRCS